MKRKHFVAIALCLGLAISSIWAATVTVTWDENTESDIAGYRVYQRLAGGTYNYNSPVDDVEHPPVELPAIPNDGATYCWVVRAYDTSGNTSGNSNEVCKTTPDTLPPQPPTGCSVTLTP